MTVVAAAVAVNASAGRHVVAEWPQSTLRHGGAGVDTSVIAVATKAVETATWRCWI